MKTKELGIREKQIARNIKSMGGINVNDPIKVGNEINTGVDVHTSIAI